MRKIAQWIKIPNDKFLLLKNYIRKNFNKTFYLLIKFFYEKSYKLKKELKIFHRKKNCLLKKIFPGKFFLQNFLSKKLTRVKNSGKIKQKFYKKKIKGQTDFCSQ